jgi:hypothetical protein
VVPMSTSSATCQKMLSACTPPSRIIRAPEAKMSALETCVCMCVCVCVCVCV